MTNKQRAILSVTQVTKLLNEVLISAIPSILVEGEISEIRSGKGHLWITLKDEGSQLATVIWASVAKTLKFTPRVGQKVQCEGHFSYWAGGARLNFVIRRIAESGEGLLRQRFLELKAKLEQEGLFDKARKRTLPRLPRAVGIITSAEGAVVHDIETRIRARMPHLPRYLVDVRVQGQGAAEEIARALQLLSRAGLVDVIIVGRGGGSLEDLWAFNEEVVVRAIFGAAVPVVSAVGHETDVTLADFAADVRAPTPTAAAELVVPDRAVLTRETNDLARRLGSIEDLLAPREQALEDEWGRLRMYVFMKLSAAGVALKAGSGQLRQIEPRRLLERLRLETNAMLARLAAEVRAQLQRQRIAVHTTGQRLAGVSPRQRCQVELVELRSRWQRLRAAASAWQRSRSDRLTTLGQRIEATDHRRVLARGFAIVRQRGRIVSEAATLRSGDQVAVELKHGGFDAAVAAVRQAASDMEERKDGRTN
ncbi:MAG: exodeoxyribonuclease VII large subunit [Bdellovibrionota bacterium]|nr:MAG: exodeoxyribonuclease VII large subunit [Bdellovibrionota bacterium]